MTRALEAFCWLLSGALVVLLVEPACTPAQRAELHDVGPPATRAACVLLRALTSSGTVDEVCATADDLAPFVAELLARTEDRPANATALAFSLPAPRRAQPRRRCAAWISLTSGDGGTVGDASHE